MPSVVIEPANGSSISASAQVLHSKNTIIGAGAADGWTTFAPLSTTGAGALRDEVMAVLADNLQGIYVNAYQYPEYDRGDVVFPARISLEWRIVFSNPPDVKPPLTGFVAAGGLPLYNWIPATPPMLLIPGVPVPFHVCCAGFSLVSIEVRDTDPDTDPAQQDRVVFSISASQ